MAKKRGRKGKKGKKPKVDCKFKITNEMLKPMNESKCIDNMSSIDIRLYISIIYYIICPCQLY